MVMGEDLYSNMSGNIGVGLCVCGRAERLTSYSQNDTVSTSRHDGVSRHRPLSLPETRQFWLYCIREYNIIEVQESLLMYATRNIIELQRSIIAVQ
jgi:hypothetical protein